MFGRRGKQETDRKTGQAASKPGARGSLFVRASSYRPGLAPLRAAFAPSTRPTAALPRAPSPGTSRPESASPLSSGHPRARKLARIPTMAQPTQHHHS
eukprot:scaffold5036_cov117-Isochrysis_galbana.AAC.12